MVSVRGLSLKLTLVLAASGCSGRTGSASDTAQTESSGESSTQDATEPTEPVPTPDLPCEPAESRRPGFDSWDNRIVWDKELVLGANLTPQARVETTNDGEPFVIDSHYAAKLSASGELQWSLGPDDLSTLDGGYAVLPDGLLALATVSEPDGEGWHFYSLQLRKYSPQGELVWETSVPEDNLNQSEGLATPSTPDLRSTRNGVFVLLNYAPWDWGTFSWALMHVTEDGTITYITRSSDSGGDSPPLSRTTELGIGAYIVALSEDHPSDESPFTALKRFDGLGGEATPAWEITDAWSENRAVWGVRSEGGQFAVLTERWLRAYSGSDGQQAWEHPVESCGETLGLEAVAGRYAVWRESPGADQAPPWIEVLGTTGHHLWGVHAPNDGSSSEITSVAPAELGGLYVLRRWTHGDEHGVALALLEP